MKHRIKIRILRTDHGQPKKAIVTRRIDYDHKAVNLEVLADNGKWREKGPADLLFDDEKLEIEEA